jgi:hypothetical protein
LRNRLVPRRLREAACGGRLVMYVAWCRGASPRGDGRPLSLVSPTGMVSMLTVVLIP